jgi:hypothetical protein
MDAPATIYQPKTGRPFHRIAVRATKVTLSLSAPPAYSVDAGALGYNPEDRAGTSLDNAGGVDVAYGPSADDLRFTQLNFGDEPTVLEADEDEYLVVYAATLGKVAVKVERPVVSRTAEGKVKVT